MESKSKKQSLNEQKPTVPSLKKNLAVAAMAASLGLSLGVPVGDVLAGDGPGSPPAYSRQDKDNVASEQMKLSNQLKDTVSVQHKDKVSNQLKDAVSNQIKLDEASQIKGDALKKKNSSVNKQ